LVSVDRRERRWLHLEVGNDYDTSYASYAPQAPHHVSPTSSLPTVAVPRTLLSEQTRVLASVTSERGGESSDTGIIIAPAPPSPPLEMVPSAQSAQTVQRAPAPSNPAGSVRAVGASLHAQGGNNNNVDDNVDNDDDNDDSEIAQLSERRSSRVSPCIDLNRRSPMRGNSSATARRAMRRQSFEAADPRAAFRGTGGTGGAGGAGGRTGRGGRGGRIGGTDGNGNNIGSNSSNSSNSSNGGNGGNGGELGRGKGGWMGSRLECGGRHRSMAMWIKWSPSMSPSTRCVNQVN
jgi:hypothetical protein